MTEIITGEAIRHRAPMLAAYISELTDATCLYVYRDGRRLLRIEIDETDIVRATLVADQLLAGRGWRATRGWATPFAIVDPWDGSTLDYKAELVDAQHCDDCRAWVERVQL